MLPTPQLYPLSTLNPSPSERHMRSVLRSPHLTALGIHALQSTLACQHLPCPHVRQMNLLLQRYHPGHRGEAGPSQWMQCQPELDQSRICEQDRQIYYGEGNSHKGDSWAVGCVVCCVCVWCSAGIHWGWPDWWLERKTETSTCEESWNQSG